MCNKYDFVGAVSIEFHDSDKTFKNCSKAIFWAGPVSWICERPKDGVFVFQGRVGDVHLEDLQIMCFASAPKKITNRKEVGSVIKDVHVGTVRMKLVDALKGSGVVVQNCDPVQGDMLIVAKAVHLPTQIAMRHNNETAVKALVQKKLRPLTQKMLDDFNVQQQLQVKMFVDAVKGQGLKFHKEGVLDENAETVYANTVLVPVVHINQCVDYKLPFTKYDPHHMFGFIMSTLRISGIPCEGKITPDQFERFLENLAPHSASFMTYASDLKLNEIEQKLFQSEDISVMGDVPYKRFSGKAFQGDCEDLATGFRVIVHSMKDFCKGLTEARKKELERELCKHPLFQQWKPVQVKKGLEQCESLSAYLDKVDTHLILMTAFAPSMDTSGKEKKVLCGHCAAGIVYNSRLMVAELTAPVRIMAPGKVPSLASGMARSGKQVKNRVEKTTTDAMYYNLQAKANMPCEDSKPWLHMTRVAPGVFWNVAGVVGNYIPVRNNVMGMPLSDINDVEDIQSVSLDAPKDLEFFVTYSTPPPMNVLRFYSRQVSPPLSKGMDGVPIAYIVKKCPDSWVKGGKDRYAVNIGDHWLAVQHVAKPTGDIVIVQRSNKPMKK